MLPALKVNNLHITTDILSALLADKRSANTKRAYQNDISEFFTTVLNTPVSPQGIQDFLGLGRMKVTAVVLSYKAMMMQRGLAEATVNRRLSAIKSLASYANKVGVCEWNLSTIQGEKIVSYRDTTGITINQMIDMLNIFNKDTAKGKRDYAILRLLWDNALRRGEVASLSMCDYDTESGTLAIMGKGRGTQKEIISLSSKTNQAMQEWLSIRGEAQQDEPVFIALDNCNKGHRLTGDAITKLVDAIAKASGINKKMSAHRLRHSSITAALEVTNGNVVKVQKLSRHAKVETLMIYEDRRANQQKEVTDLLSDMV